MREVWEKIYDLRKSWKYRPESGEKIDLDYQEFKDGETRKDFFTRITTCLEEIISLIDDDIILVTHGGAVAYIVAWWMKFHNKMFEEAYFQSSVGSISILYKNRYNQNTLELFNDTSHLNVWSLNNLIVNFK